MKWKDLILGLWAENMTLQHLSVDQVSQDFPAFELLMKMATAELSDTPLQYFDAPGMNGTRTVNGVHAHGDYITKLATAAYFMYIGSWTSAKGVYESVLQQDDGVYQPWDHYSTSMLGCFTAEILVDSSKWLEDNDNYESLLSCCIQSSALMYSLGLVLNDLDTQSADTILKRYRIFEKSNGLGSTFTGVLRYLTTGSRGDFHVDAESCNSLRRLINSLKTMTDKKYNVVVDLISSACILCINTEKDPKRGKIENIE